MAMYKVELSPHHAQRIETLAKQIGIRREELLRRRISRRLGHPDNDFTRAADYVLDKNTALYDRLS